MCETATDGAAIADLRMSDIGDGFMKQGSVFGHKRISFRLGLLGHRANVQGSILSHIAQFMYSVEVNQERRLGDPKIHGRDQALPASQHLTLIAVLRL
jgi:hypothetical protein